jgi:hypothetical protein
MGAKHLTVKKTLSKVDFFDQIPPDDPSNCARRIVISSKADNKSKGNL